MEIIIPLLIVLAFITIVGHVIWLGIAATLRWLFVDDAEITSIELAPRNGSVVAKLSDLKITERQVASFHRDGKLTLETYGQLLTVIRAERERLLTPEVSNPQPAPQASVKPPTAVAVSTVAPAIEPAPVQPQRPVPPRPPRRSFSEVLSSFMEESNIRWGEIIGGLLIIGCSTALVVSLWAQISQIPVLKFLIFTTVTAILFGIGLYSEHRWKLPTTSRGILTIATLLVPLNFLAIAAVSASNMSGALVIGSELVAPAIFLCLVYFAGRIITPGCAHILSAGVLGSSVGQLLVRHFASLDAPPSLLIVLGAFPVMCYVVTVGLALRVVLTDRHIDEHETTTIFTALGTMSFAALLPFGLLLYKSGPLAMSMMYLAPIVTLWGVPLLATGTILWRKISNRELVAARTTGTALGLLGLMIVLAGMILAWPNPASIVPAALLNFVIFTALAVALDLAAGHLIAAMCFALAYLVSCHVFAGNITWENLRVMSLLDVSLSVASGQVLVGAFAFFVIAAEWLTKRGRSRDSFYYLVAACVIAIVSLALATVFGVASFEPHALWIVYGLYALGAFWIAWRRRLVEFTWAGSALLLFALAQNFAQAGYEFPWQTAFFAHAGICAVIAIMSLRRAVDPALPRSVLSPFNYSALISIVFGVVCLFQANTWEITWTQAQRVFWIASILLLLLWLNRRKLILNAFQIALICALVLTVKAALQGYEWYSYLPHAFLHPAALQIQGTVLALVCLVWLTFRLLVRRARSASQAAWLTDAARLLDDNYAVDRFVVWLLVPSFLLLAIYGSLSGVTRELSALGSGYAGLDVAGFPHNEALGIGSWVVLGLLLMAMLMSFWERRRYAYLLGAIAALSGTIPLLAGHFENEFATATAWRWLAAAFLIVASSTIWLRHEISARLSTFGWPGFDNETFVSKARTLLLTLTVGPILLLTIYPAARAIYYLPVQGPTAGFFFSFGDTLSYGVPLVVVALVLIGYALRERAAAFAFTAGVFLNATVTLAFLLAVVSAQGLMDRVVLVRLVQLNAITFAVYLLPWISTRRRWQSGLVEDDQRFADRLLKLQLWLAIGLNATLYLSALGAMVMFPEQSASGTIATGSSLGWLSLFCIVVAVAWLATQRVVKPSSWSLLAFFVGLSCLIACGVSAPGTWLGLHVLTVCIAATAWLMLAADDTDPRYLRLSAAVAGAFATLLALRCVIGSEGQNAWWSIGPLLAMTVLAAALNWTTKTRAYIYAGGLLFFVSISLWSWLVERNAFDQFLLVHLVAHSLAGIVWLALDLRSRKSDASISHHFSWHNVAAVACLSVLALLVVASFALSPPEVALIAAPRLTWFAVASVVVLMTACLFDRYAKFAVAGLYTLGLIACAIGLQQLEVSPMRLRWSATIVLGVYALVTSLLWHWREHLIDFAKRIGVPERISADVKELNWLSAFNVIVVATITAFAYWINLTFDDFSLRVTAALALAAQCLTFGLLAEGRDAQRWRRAAIAVFVGGVVFVGWSWLTPGVNATWLNRSVIAMVITFGVTALYGWLLDKATARFPDWTISARACVPFLLAAGSLALFFCLVTEVRYQLDFGMVLIHPLSLMAIGLTLVAAIVIGVLFALSPAHDPLGLSERGRMRYVYVAEVMLALLFLHVRLTMPWLFTGFIERYWPLAVMLIAYFGVVTSEALRRRQLLVLAQPLERTGAFIPLLPVLGFWIATSDVDFSMLLFIVGGLYGLLSILRRSFVFGVVAAVAGNAGLWYAFQRTADYGFLQHPQLWLIPVAVSVLIAAYLNEDKLTEDQMSGVRYLSLVTIYVSSTADIFINGVANSPWLPLILGSFALAGVFAGILFRIRGLVVLGSIFLLLSIVTMIWYASVNLGWTWLWYVAGIVTGATIIFMFAMFEKQRRQLSHGSHRLHG
jgi:hypothetical protein